MFKRRITTIAAVGAVLLLARLAQPLARDVRSDTLAQRISSLLRNLPDPSVKCGVVVVDLATGSVVYAQDGHVPLIPASNQKLLVMAAAIDLLGPGFEFRTVIGVRGPDLVIVGDGDPALGDARLCKRAGTGVTAVFERWADELKRTGHAVIPGDLIIDESIFDEQATHPSWEANDLQKWYAAPVGALNLNDNCVELTVWPADRVGLPPFWSVTPPSTLIELVNRATSSGSGVPVISRPSPTFTFILSGRCGSRATLESVPVPDPGLFFADACLLALRRAGVSIGGQIRRERLRGIDGRLPGDVEVIAAARTPISDVLNRIGKNSQNLFSECLMKRIGYEHALNRVRFADQDPNRSAKRTLPRGSWAGGAAAIEGFLNRCNIDIDGIEIADASGLSRRNRVTAAQIAGVLRHMHTHVNRRLFVDNLAMAGQDGSLRRRMRDLGGRVIGKTGTLRGVKSLSGYVHSFDGRWYAFSIIFNDIRAPSGPYKRVQDELCRLLVSAPGWHAGR